MPRGKPLEGAPGWRVIERPQRRSWRAGYVIVPVALLAGLLQAYVTWHEGWGGWANELRQALMPSDSASDDGTRLPRTGNQPKTVAGAEPGHSARGRQTAESRIARKQEGTRSLQAARAGANGRGSAGEAEERDAPSAAASDSQSPATAHSAPAAPTRVPIRVFIHHTEGTGNATSAIQLAAYLETHGFEVADIRAVKFDIGWPSVRYFFQRDLAPSRRLVEALGRFFAKNPDRVPYEATDFTYFAPKPRPGNVEIWMPGHLGVENQSS